MVVAEGDAHSKRSGDDRLLSGQHYRGRTRGRHQNHHGHAGRQHRRRNSRYGDRYMDIYLYRCIAAEKLDYKQTEQAVREAAIICPRPCKLTFDLLTLKVVC